MESIVECVPNFSEGRNRDSLEAIADAAKIDGVTFLGWEADADHNRCVMTWIGAPEPVGEAAFRACAAAAERIDLNHHRGEHPRMGATDVIPFIPIRGLAMEEAASLAARVGERIGEALEIPVFLYGDAARVESRQNLAWVRKGEFEGLRDLIGSAPDRTPDFGPPRIHPTAGATAVGARFFLLAYNVNLATNDLKLAKRIAKGIRTSGGGLPHVKALGLRLAEKGRVQVSMNLTDYRVTSLAGVFDVIRRRAGEAGVELAESELIGFAPADALIRAAAESMKIADFDPGQILENRL
ncbi:MAG: glutamate formimidoyltransferase [Planctomycetota bacterium]|jgi:glutamate formiminotransferase